MNFNGEISKIPPCPRADLLARLTLSLRKPSRRWRAMNCFQWKGHQEFNMSKMTFPPSFIYRTRWTISTNIFKAQHGKFQPEQLNWENYKNLKAGYFSGEGGGREACYHRIFPLLTNTGSDGAASLQSKRSLYFFLMRLWTCFKPSAKISFFFFFFTSFLVFQFKGYKLSETTTERLQPGPTFWIQDNQQKLFQIL